MEQNMNSEIRNIKFRCPKCDQEFSLDDFETDTQVITHLQAFFKDQENRYVDKLRAELKEEYNNKLNNILAIKISAKEKEWLAARDQEREQEAGLRKALNDEISNLKLDQQKLIATQQREAQMRLVELKEEWQGKVNALQNELSKVAETTKLKVSEREKELANQFNQEKNQWTTEVHNLQTQLLNAKAATQEAVSAREKELITQANKETNQLLGQISELKAELSQINEKNKLVIDQKTAQINNEYLAQKEALLANIKQLELDLQARNAQYQLNLVTKEQELTKQFAQEKDALRIEFGSEKEKLFAQIKELEQKNAEFRLINNKVKGENFENEVEGELRKVFSMDIIKKITDSDKKADFLQVICDANGKELGKIVYEVKNAEWSNAWEPKLVTDMSKQGGDYAILVASSFSDKHGGIPFMFSTVNNKIAICSPDSFTFVANMLRKFIILENSYAALMQNGVDSQEIQEKISEYQQLKNNIMTVLHTQIGTQTKDLESHVKTLRNTSDKIEKSKNNIIKIWEKGIIEKIEKLEF